MLWKNHICRVCKHDKLALNRRVVEMPPRNVCAHHALCTFVGRDNIACNAQTVRRSERLCKTHMAQKAGPITSPILVQCEGITTKGKRCKAKMPERSDRNRNFCPAHADQCLEIDVIAVTTGKIGSIQEVTGVVLGDQAGDDINNGVDDGADDSPEGSVDDINEDMEGELDERQLQDDKQFFLQYGLMDGGGFIERFDDDHKFPTEDGILINPSDDYNEQAFISGDESALDYRRNADKIANRILSEGEPIVDTDKDARAYHGNGRDDTLGHGRISPNGDTMTESIMRDGHENPSMRPKGAVEVHDGPAVQKLEDPGDEVVDASRPAYGACGDEMDIDSSD